jgi:ABC-type transport system substrate-binding protein
MLNSSSIFAYATPMPQKGVSIVVLSLLAVFSLVTIFSAVSPVVFSAAASGSSCPANRTFTFVTEPIPTNFNYLEASGDSTFFIGSLEYLSLSPFPINPNGSLDWADAATNWITANSNFTQWTFHIRPGLTWSNGIPVNSTDIADWLSPAYALNPLYDITAMHTEVTGVQIVNSDTATVILNKTDAQFPNEASTYFYAPMVSPTDVAQGPNATLFGTGIADGPYYISNYVSGSTEAVMLPNPYWPGPKPAVCSIDVIFVESYDMITPFLVSGTGDFGGVIDPATVSSLPSFIHIDDVKADEIQAMWYNETLYPWNMTQFKQAIAYSINSSAIIQHSFFGYAQPANDAQGEVPTTVPEYNPNQQMYPYNVSKSLDLLHSIGFTGGGSAGPLKFPNGTAMSVTIYTGIQEPTDVSTIPQLAGFLEALGIAASTQTLTTQNIVADYSSNAYNIRDNIVVRTSGGPFFSDPWVDSQQGCDTMGIPGCSGYTTTPSADGNTHWLYPPSADAEYQTNLTKVDGTSSSNVTGQIAYLDNIEALQAQYLPAIALSYPDKLFAYNTEHWTNWPPQGDWFLVGQFNTTMINALQPVTSSSSTSTTTTLPTSTTSLSTSTSTSTTMTSTSVTTTTSTSMSTSTTTSSSSATLEIVAAIVVVIVIIAGLAAYMMRRKPSGTPSGT